MNTGRPRLAFLRDRFAELVGAGSTVEAAAKAVRVHRATAYRWCEQIGLHKRPYRRMAEK
jgi:transposase